MDAWLQGLGVVTAVLSAVAFYAGSVHCLWPRLRGRPLFARGLGYGLAVLSLVAWVHALGAAGACAMLACWMLALVAQPWLALLFFGGPRAGHASARHPGSYKRLGDRDGAEEHRPRVGSYEKPGDRGGAEGHRPHVGSYEELGDRGAAEAHRPRVGSCEGRGVVGGAR